MKERAFKIDKINRSKYMDNIEFFNSNLKIEDLFMSMHPTKSYKKIG